MRVNSGFTHSMRPSASVMTMPLSAAASAADRTRRSASARLRSVTSRMTDR
jgi:hypothetical protein